MESIAKTADAAHGSSSDPAGPEQPGAYTLFRRTTIGNIHRAYGGEDAFLATGFAKILELEGGDKERAYKTLDEIIHTNWDTVGPEMRNLFEDAASRYKRSRPEVGSKANTGPSTPPVPHHDPTNSDDSDTDDEMKIGLWLAKVKRNRISSGVEAMASRREASAHESVSAGALVQEKEQSPARAQTDTQKPKPRRVGDSSSDNGGAKKGKSRDDTVVPALSTHQANSGRRPSAGRRAQGTIRAASLPTSGTGRSEATKATGTVIGGARGASSPENATVRMTAMERRGSGHKEGDATNWGRSRGAGLADLGGTAGTATRSGALPIATTNGSKRSRSNDGVSSPTNMPGKRKAPKSARNSVPPPTTTIRSVGLGRGSTAPAQLNAATSGGATPMALTDLTTAPEEIGSTRVSPGVVTRRRAASTGGTLTSGMIGHPGVERMLTEKESKTSRVRRKSQAGSSADPAASAPEELVHAPITDTTVQVRRNLCSADGMRASTSGCLSSTRIESSKSSASTSALDSRGGSPAEAAAAAPMSQERISRKVDTTARMGGGKTMGALVVLYAPKDEMEAEADGYVSCANESCSSLSPESKKLNAAVGLADLAEGPTSLTKENKRGTEGPQSQMKGAQSSAKTSMQKYSKTKDNVPFEETKSSSTGKANTEHRLTGEGRGGRELGVPAPLTAVSAAATDDHTQWYGALGGGKGREGGGIVRETSRDTFSPPGGQNQAQAKGPVGKARREEGSSRALAREKSGPSTHKKKGAQANGPCDTSEGTADGGSAAATTAQSTIRAAYAKARSARRRLVRRAERMRGPSAGANGATGRLRKVAVEGARRIPRATAPKGTERKGINRASSEPGAAPEERTDGALNVEQGDAVNGRNIFGIPCEKKAAIEVLWEVEDQTSRRLGEETKTDWFNAFVDLTTMRGIDEDGRPEWNIAYPVRRSPLNKYQPIKGLKSYVVFLSKDSLRDAENDEPLRWRKKVDTHDKTAR